MSARFTVVVRPGAADLDGLADLYPASPFHAPAYCRARQRLGSAPLLVGLADAGRWLAGCPAFLNGRLPFQAFEIPSLVPGLDGDGTPGSFWREVARWCRRRLVARLVVDSYGSPPVVVPALPGETSRRARLEHVLDLEGPIVLATNHRRSIKRAHEAGLEIRRARTEDAVHEHLRLMGHSQDRRRRRGGAAGPLFAAEPLALIQEGAGEVFQAVQDRTVLSSVLMLLAPRGAYYHSAGTGAAGMEIGASPFLIVEAARLLKDEGRRLLNLGDATADNPGLLRFKQGFGGRAVPLEAVSADALPLVARLWDAARRARGRGPD